MTLYSINIERETDRQILHNLRADQLRDVIVGLNRNVVQVHICRTDTVFLGDPGDINIGAILANDRPPGVP